MAFLVGSLLRETSANVRGYQWVPELDFAKLGVFPCWTKEALSKSHEHSYDSSALIITVGVQCVKLHKPAIQPAI